MTTHNPTNQGQAPEFQTQQEMGRMTTALKGIYAALSQNKTYPADVAYAKRIAKDALGY